MTRRTSCFSVLLSFLTAVPAVAAGQASAALQPAAAAVAGKAPLSADVMWRIKRLGAPAISPDGRWAVVPVTAYDAAADKALTDLWLVPTAGGEARALTSHEGAETSPAWSPDGQWIAFEAKRGDDENAQIYVLPLGGGEARRVTNLPTGASAPKWFPDSRRLAFISRVWRDLKTADETSKRLKERRESKMTARTWDKAPIRYWDRWLDDREAHVFAVPLAGGEPTAVTLGTGLQLSASEPGPSSYDLSPDGKEVAFAADVDRTGIDSNFDVFVVPAEGGTARNISSENPAGDDAPRYSPDGRFIAFGRQVIKDFYGDRVRLVLHDRAARTNRVVTEAWDRSVGEATWMPDSRGLIASIDDAGTLRVYRIDSMTGTPAAVTGETSFSSLAVARGAGAVVALRQGFSEPPTLVRLDPATGSVAKISTFNDDQLANVNWGRYESVTYKGSGGKDIQMWVVYPPDFDPSKRWPLYLLLHGGPHNGITDSFTFRWNAHVFAGWGYVTAWHNFHGSSGFGQAFADSINPDWATKPYEDTIAAATWFASKPWIDRERMAAGGGSYGGYLATLLLGRPHPFKTLVAHAAVYNLYTQYASDGGADTRRFGHFWAPDQDALYREMSPHFGAPDFKVPTLVIHGALDYRVPDNHGIELFNTLQTQGIRSRLIFYPNENHWVLKPQNSLYWYQSTRDWLKEFVGSGPQ